MDNQTGEDSFDFVIVMCGIRHKMSHTENDSKSLQQLLYGTGEYVVGWYHVVYESMTLITIIKNQSVN